MLGRGAIAEPDFQPLTAPVAQRPLRLLSDEQLARRVSAGDRGAFTVLYERHLPAIVRYCRGILLSQEDAEDAAQNAMISALESLPGRPAKLALKAWLMRVAHNEAISQMRRRRPQSSLEEAENVSIADVCQTVANRARLRELLIDLASLPDRQRGALVMRELCGCDYDEIAAALGGSEGAAMQTVFEARTALVQFDRGRNVNCDEIQRLISDGDRRALRARRIRAHMRSCSSCREFESSITRRRGDLALLFPLAAKSGMAGLLALAGLHHTRPGALTLVNRMQGVPNGMRAAALSALVAVGGGITTVDLGRSHSQTPSHVHASAPARVLAATRGRAVTATLVPVAPPRHRDAGAASPHPGVRTASAASRGAGAGGAGADESRSSPAGASAAGTPTGSSSSDTARGPIQVFSAATIEVSHAAVSANVAGAKVTVTASAPPTVSADVTPVTSAATGVTAQIAVSLK